MQMIFVNLPVSDIPKARAFYGALGFTFNEQYSNNEAACVVVSESIYVMLLLKSFFATFTDKPISDAHKQTEVLLCLSSESREAADAMVARAVAAGGSAPRPPKDYGFMYQQGFEDPDGHLWELAVMLGQPPAN
jgi:predicted lactoylglutathione lyase